MTQLPLVEGPHELAQTLGQCDFAVSEGTNDPGPARATPGKRETLDPTRIDARYPIG